MYEFLVIRLCQDQTTLLEAITNLASPLVYEGLEIKRELDTNCVLINGTKYSVPTNGKNTIEVNGTSIGFSYFTADADTLDW
jgi:hypothetical protein